MLQPKKPVKVVEKKTTVTTKPKKSKTVSQRIGDITLRDVKNATETALDLSTLGGYRVAKKKIKELMNDKNGGKVKKAANGTSLGMKSVKAGFDKNPGVTRADIITAAKGKAKSGKTIKKGQNSSIMRPVGLDIDSAMKDMQRLRKEKMDREKENAKNPSSTSPSFKRPDSSMSNPYSTSGVNPATLAKSGKTMRKAKSGSALKKQAATAIAMKKAGKAPKGMKAGGKMTKCKYGCK